MAVNVFPQPVPYNKRPVPPVGRVEVTGLADYLTRELGAVERAVAATGRTPGRTVTADVIATSSDGLVAADASGGALTVTLPGALRYGGRIFYVKKVDATANVVTVAASGTDTIDGAASVTLGTQYEAVELYAREDRWEVLSQANILAPGGVSGSGTVNVLSKWTAATALGDSLVSESGATVTVTGSLSVTTNATVTGNLTVTGTLTANGAVSLSPANANVVLSPTGTGVVTINPATAGTMNNVTIGGSTPLAGTFTAVTGTTGTFTNLLQITRTSEQLRLRYDGSNYLRVTVNSVGVAEFVGIGTDAAVRFGSTRLEVDSTGGAANALGVTKTVNTDTSTAGTSFTTQVTSSVGGTITNVTGFAAIARTQGSSTSNVTNLTAVRAELIEGGSGTVANGYLFRALTPSGSYTSLYGLYVEAMTGGGTNYAIYTNAGTVRFGDIVAVNGATPSTSTALITTAGTTAISSLRIPHGAAPTSPVDGDMWTTTAGLYVRINGATVGPLS